MTLFNSKYTNIFGDTEVSGRSPDAEGDYYLVGDAQNDNNYWNEKIVDVISVLSNSPAEEFSILYGCIVSDGGSGTINISEGVVKGKDSDGKKRLIPMPAITGLALPSGWNNDRQIWVIAKHDFKLTTDQRAHRAGVNYHYTLQDTYIGDTDSENTVNAQEVFVDADPVGTAPILGSFKMNGTTFTNLSLNTRTPVLRAIGDDRVVGSTIKTEKKFRDISSSHPWFCLSKPSVVQTTANYSQEYIDSQRSIKWIYEEAGATPVSSFGGAWVTNEFTLDNNATNIAFLAELLEDWEFHGKPTTGWRILFDGTTELDITNIVLSTRKITTDANGSGASIEIYTNRVKGSTTSCKHFTEAGLADYQAGGGKIAGALRRDQLQGHYHTTYGSLGAGTGQRATTGTESNNNFNTKNGEAKELISDGTNDAPRKGVETRAKSATVFKYLFCGSFTV